MDSRDIIVGHYYRAKETRKVPRHGGFNDRRVTWVKEDGSSVQYDSYTINIGRHLPTIPMEKFLKWAAKKLQKKNT